MIQFDKLRIQGFKSFVDKTELEIGPGLNGVVGPNGCGKSNLVESLRWVMGETSAKRMRGGGMEDVIFAGTDRRPARNIAEVSLLLDNKTRKAPALYNGSDELEVIRRIERDRGSHYRINGKTVRARDVQMLFADSIAGANSPAMVSQGRVTEIINSKPNDRRMILEESAGISGLFVRRHEAQLRLKAASTNLTRLEDIVGSMESRYNSLKKQVRQATKYKNLNAQIRQLELLLAHLEYQDILTKQKQVKESFESAESITAEKMAAVSQLTQTQTTQSESLPDLRKAEAEAAAALQTKRIALQRIEEDKERHIQEKDQTARQLEQTQADLQHETQILTENAAALEKMKYEQEKLAEEEKNDSGRLEEKQKLVDELEAKVEKLEKLYNEIIQGEAEKKARKQSLEQQLEQNNNRLKVITQRKEKFESDLKSHLEKDKNSDSIRTLEEQIQELGQQSESTKDKLSKLHQTIQETEAAIDKNRKEVEESASLYSEIKAEMGVLQSFFESLNHDHKPIIDEISTEEGFEKAISRALGDSLMASIEEDAPTRWLKRDNIKDSPPLPNGAKPLKSYVKAPKELDLALSQIGYVEDDSQGQTLAAELKVGQSLVSAKGTYWRWDGFMVKNDASDSHLIQLEQKNKLEQLQSKLPSIESDHKKNEDALNNNLEQLKTQKDERADSQRYLQETDNNLTRSRAELSTLREENARYDTEKEHLESALATAKEDIKTLEEVIGWDQKRLDQMVEDQKEEGNSKSDELKNELVEIRADLQNAIRNYDMLQQKQNSRAARLRALADESVNLKNRSIRSRDRTQSLDLRLKELKEKSESLNALPKDFDSEKEDLLNALTFLEKDRDRAAQKLAESEGELASTNKALKEAQEELSLSREKRAGSQATMQGLYEQLDHMTIAVREKFDLAPQDISKHITMDLENAPNLNQARNDKENLTRQRDALGAVNLRAEEEMNELDGELGQMLHEREDLSAAIDELHKVIQKINKEARERLLFAFDKVNEHFSRLFVQLFNGGTAHLKLIEADDPLESGLEIFAQPPGKALQSLSLLSGGEQTMASIALIFAMFLTNPSPICVLDEIDAPLDDSNVDRVCDLLDEIAERGETRFIVITHHRLTMARMNRLYGVTMSEKGISQLVSVDLQQSFDFLDEAA